MPDLISSPHNDRVKYVRSLYEPRVQRRERAFVIEGVRLTEEALDAGCRPSLVLIAPASLERTDRGRRLGDRLRPFRPIEATEQVLKAAANTVTPQGVLAVLPMPVVQLGPLEGPLPLVLDGLNDPGNVGTILRTAWASGIVRDVVAIGGAALHSPKVVRSGAGAHFHLRLHFVESPPAFLSRMGSFSLLIASSSSGTHYREISWAGKVLAIGSEARGARSELLSAAEMVHIPMRGGAESLNAAVAAGILLFEAAAKLT